MDPILAVMVRYGLDRATAELALACARMAQVLVYGEEQPPPIQPEQRAPDTQQADGRADGLVAPRVED